MKHIFTSFFALLFIIPSSAQSNWTSSSNGIPQKFTVWGFISVSASEILAAGDDYSGSPIVPQIYKSTDAGNNWTAITTTGMPGDIAYSKIALAGSTMLMTTDQNVGSCRIYSSTDGTDWALANTGIADSFIAYDFIVISPTEVYAVGGIFSYLTNPLYTAAIYKTTNGGSNWTQVNVSGTANNNYSFAAGTWTGTKMLLDAETNNQATGLAIYSSTDGINWSLSNGGVPANFNVYDFLVLSSSEIYAIGGTYESPYFHAGIYKSTDGGSNWLPYPVTGMENDHFLYVSGLKAGNDLLIGAGDSLNDFTIYRSQLATGLTETGWNNFTVSPNPAINMLHVQCKEEGEFYFSILDINGRVLSTQTTRNGDCMIPVKDFAEGTYLLKVEGGGHTGKLVFVKE